MTGTTLPAAAAHARTASTLVFGGHIGPQSKRTLAKHIRHMLAGVNGPWILETVRGLPRYWDAVVEQIPEVAGTMQGGQLLGDLEAWVRDGAASEEEEAGDADAELPDLWLGPLMIAVQLDQYWRYLQFRFPGVQDPQAELVRVGGGRVETVGFCAGMIVATAVASSHGREEFEKYGAAALRVGVLLGALVGAGEAWDKGLGKGGSVSLATAWRTAKQGDDMARIVAKLSPNAYVSVLFDEARATVTASERLVPKLVRQLRAAGVTAIPLAFKGKLHTPGAERERHTEALIQVCHAMPELQFPDAADLALPTYMDHPEGKPVSSDEVDLMGTVLRSVLFKQLNWAATVSKLAANDEDVALVAFGLDRPLGPTILRRFGPRQVQFEDIEDHVGTPVLPSQQQKLDSVHGTNGDSPIPATEPSNSFTERCEDDDDDMIAIVGMSLKTAGADDIAEFASMLRTGVSQHEPITRDRMTHDMLFRPSADADPTRKWYGNFMRDADAFDHKFFKRSPREAMAMDPQARHSLQGAYHAVAQSGYFHEMAVAPRGEHEARKHVGVYVGLCSFEYEINIICHPTSAFTATGALRSFIPGRVAHYFGWTGPALTFDTACSSSTVALHNACRDLQSGEVRAALCGGVNVLTNLQWTQNLAAGSFISPSGQCKPFDVDADGYCRGDGIAYVFLKKLSTAKADGNMVLGTIRATGVNQNLNSTPLFVPNVPSLSRLFKDVVRKARVEPRDISLVECHGTGTPVGDPAEYESIRMAVAGPLRDTVLPIGSAKGHVGHTEGASGIVSLIKIITMMRDGFIPPQASFEKMNPNIRAQPADNMEVVTSLRPWRGDRKVALLNNYGACGNNSSAVVAYTAHKPTNTLSTGSAASSIQPRFPFWIAGLDARSIAAYSAVLAPYLRSHAGSADSPATLADVSFNMNRQSNPNLPQGLIFSCSSVAELQAKLSQAVLATTPPAASMGIAPIPAERPVVLCFGGQTSTFVGLDRALYDGVAVLRHHLDICNAAVTSQGLNSIYPDIFSCEPIQDVVRLQMALFAMQYASAKSWMDCGLADKVVSLVGHSFGEMTALCVAGVLSLEDTVRLIAGRAKLVRDAWGPDAGAMMAVVGDEAFVNDVLKESNLASDGSAGIACYNSRRSFTIAGSTKAVDAFAITLAEKSSGVEGVKSKRLSVTNAFHSSLVEKLVDGLDAVGKQLTFNEPVIPIERATKQGHSTAPIDWSFVGSHMRLPVFFDHAVQRLHQKHPQAIFLEAGSNSTVTVMASRALAQAEVPAAAGTLHFQAVSMTNTKAGVDGLTDATVALWKQGVRVAFWAHHSMQTGDYTQLLLPPYQFEKSRHWLELKSPTEQVIKVAQEMIAKGNSGALAGQDDAKTLPMWTFMGYEQVSSSSNNKKKTAKVARFRINTASDKYQRLFATHVIAQTAPICPATLEIDVAIEALFSLNGGWRENGYSPVVRDMLSHSPICADSTRVHYIDLEPVNQAETEWHFTIHSVGVSSAAPADKHAEARIHMYSPSDPSFVQEFGRWERVVSHAQCQAVLRLGPNDEGVESLQGRNVYRAFESVVDFGEVYQGVKCVVGREGESAGVVQKRHSGDTWLDVPKTDCFGQVAGMFVNLLTDVPASDMFVATGLELTMRSPTIPIGTDGRENGAGVWHVLARHARPSDKAYVTDVFVFDGATGALAEVILGLRYVRIAKATMGKILARMTVDKAFVRGPQTGAAQALSSSSSSAPEQVSVVAGPVTRVSALAQTEQKDARVSSTKGKPADGRQLSKEVRNVVANVSGMDAGDITLESELADLGIDSLMAMELAREVESTFQCTLDHSEQMEATNVRQFVACVASALARATGSSSSTADDEDDDETASSVSSTRDEATASSVSTPDELPDGRSKQLAPLGRETEAESLLALSTAGWVTPALEAAALRPRTRGRGGAVVVVTGGTGSLGCHLVQALATSPLVATVVCLNRPLSNIEANQRQATALASRGIALTAEGRAKLRVLATDTAKAQLGLPAAEYAWLVQHASDIVHAAWPMSGSRALASFAPQARAMRNLLDLARDMATATTCSRRVGFQFVSSIGVTGCSPPSQSPVLEQALPLAAAMPSGYNEAKWVCERMLAKTLRAHPQLFCASVVRPGQISGSTASGVWNPVEHFAFVVKSAQALRAWPDLRGELHWLPVDCSAVAMVELLLGEGNNTTNNDINTLGDNCYPVYHVDNPVGQPWADMSTVLAAALDIPPSNIIPFADWIALVRQSSLSDAENPAMRAIDFLATHFERMACGGIVLDTRRAAEHSPTLARQGPVTADVVRSYVAAWKNMGFLK